jgi:hypothetical protein
MQSTQLLAQRIAIGFGRLLPKLQAFLGFLKERFGAEF